MDLKTEILREHSKRQSLRIAAWVGRNRWRFKQLMELFLHGEYRVTQRSAWVVSHIGMKHPKLITPWLPAMLKRMQEPGVHIAVKRNVLRVLAEIPIPQALLGRVVSICFDELGKPESPTAVRVYSMQTLGKIAEREPGITRELRDSMERMLPYGGAGIQSCATKVLKRLERRKVDSGGGN